jgi:hypothetical protein
VAAQPVEDLRAVPSGTSVVGVGADHPVEVPGRPLERAEFEPDAVGVDVDAGGLEEVFG